MKKKNKYITVLDFEINRVFQYKLDFDELSNYNNKIIYEDYEEFITNKGHNLTNCEWMVHEVAGIINNNDGSYGKL